MTVSIRVNENGEVTTINQRAMTGEGWIQLPDDEVPEIAEDDVAVTYHWDGDTMTAEPTQVSVDEDI